MPREFNAQMGCIYYSYWYPNVNINVKAAVNTLINYALSEIKCCGGRCGFFFFFPFSFSFYRWWSVNHSLLSPHTLVFIYFDFRCFITGWQYGSLRIYILDVSAVAENMRCWSFIFIQHLFYKYVCNPKTTLIHWNK